MHLHASPPQAHVVERTGVCKNVNHNWFVIAKHQKGPKYLSRGKYGLRISLKCNGCMCTSTATCKTHW